LNTERRRIVMNLKTFIIAACIVFFTASTATAVSTHITVMVKTKDAKFLGTSMGGALVKINNALTGELLTKGITEGTTGSTDLIMIKPHERGAVISNERSAKFSATIDIEEPTQIEVIAKGPLSEHHAVNSVKVTQWVMPGKHINRGDALMLELPGLMVKLLTPIRDSSFDAARTVKIQAVVRMM
jgi:hypothetical protein